MFPIILLLSSLLITQLPYVAPVKSSFSYHGFSRSKHLSLSGAAHRYRNHMVLVLSDETKGDFSHVFYSTPFVFKNSSNSPVNSFSTSFVFAMDRGRRNRKGGGLAFVIAPAMDLSTSSEPGYLGIFDESTNGNASNRVFAVELDTMMNEEFHDPDDNHVGFDINSVVSLNTSHVGYGNATQEHQPLDLISRKKIHVSIDYNGTSQTIEVIVSLFPDDFKKDDDDDDDDEDVEGDEEGDGEEIIGRPLPKYDPILSTSYNLSTVMNEQMYVGFSTTSGSGYTYLLAWNFAMNRKVNTLATCEVPRVPMKPVPSKAWISAPVIISAFLLLVLSYYVYRKLKFAEIVEGWEAELNYISHRFRYKDLYSATKGFNKTELLGIGGFGEVYRGVMPHSNAEVALKRISHDSRQGMKEFVAEIVSLGRLRHRNLVPLLGYCRRKGELLLVYEYMHNGSLDKLLHGVPSSRLTWDQRFGIIKGVACGLLYLHEEWEQVVIHRDIKPGNVLLDAELNPRLGDFGLARLHDHGSDPSTTNIVGTLGYLAPEHTKTGRATKSIDVFAFGALILEVVSGRRPIQPDVSKEETILVDWVHSLWNKSRILLAVDPKLSLDYREDEAELVLKLGLVCSHARPEIRPNIRDIIGYLDDPTTFPEDQCADALESWVSGEYENYGSMISSSTDPTGNFSMTHSIFMGGR